MLLDEQLPRQLARELAGHEVRTVQREGWAGLKNGELLRRAGDRRERNARLIPTALGREKI